MVSRAVKSVLPRTSLTTPIKNQLQSGNLRLSNSVCPLLLVRPVSSFYILTLNCAILIFFSISRSVLMAAYSCHYLELYGGCQCFPLSQIRYSLVVILGLNSVSEVQYEGMMTDR